MVAGTKANPLIQPAPFTICDGDVWIHLSSQWNKRKATATWLQCEESVVVSVQHTKLWNPWTIHKPLCPPGGSFKQPSQLGGCQRCELLFPHVEKTTQSKHTWLSIHRLTKHEGSGISHKAQGTITFLTWLQHKEHQTVHSAQGNPKKQEQPKTNQALSKKRCSSGKSRDSRCQEILLASFASEMVGPSEVSMKLFIKRPFAARRTNGNNIFSGFWRALWCSHYLDILGVSIKIT